MLRDVPNLKHLLPAEADSLTAEEMAEIDSFKTATAFIIAPGVLATNYHVMSTAMRATHRHTRVLFDYDDEDDVRKDKKPGQTPLGERTSMLRPDLFFWSYKLLDICLVAFEYPSTEYAQAPPSADGQPAPLVEQRATLVPALKNPNYCQPIRLWLGNMENQLIEDKGRLCILQHPSGFRAKQLSVHGCVRHGARAARVCLLERHAQRILGLSGSQWRLVGVHHASVTVKDTKEQKAARKAGAAAAKVGMKSLNEGVWGHIHCSLGTVGDAAGRTWNHPTSSLSQRRRSRATWQMRRCPIKQSSISSRYSLMNSAPSTIACRS